jgi:hypothetical protein
VTLLYRLPSGVFTHFKSGPGIIYVASLLPSSEIHLSVKMQENLNWGRFVSTLVARVYHSQDWKYIDFPTYIADVSWSNSLQIQVLKSTISPVSSLPPPPALENPCCPCIYEVYPEVLLVRVLSSVFRSRNCLRDIYVSARLHVRRLRNRGLDSWRGRRLYLLHGIHASSGAHAASYAVETGGCFSGIKRQGRETDLSSSNAEINGVVFSTPAIRHRGVMLN